MTRVHTPNIAVLAVVLAVLTVAVAPVAVAATPGDTTTGTTIGDQLGDAGDSPDDSSGDGDGSTDSTTDDSSSDSTDDSSTDDGGSSDDSTAGETDSSDGSSTDGSSTDGSSTDDSSADGSSDDASSDSTDGTNETDDGIDATSETVSTVTEPVFTASVTEQLSESTDVAAPAAIEGGESTTTTGDSGTAAFPTLDASVFTTTTLATEDATTTLDSGAETLRGETGVVFDTIDARSTTGTTTSTRFEPTRLQSVPETTRSLDVGSGPTALGGASATGSTPLPQGPTNGLALGVGALAAAGVTRTSALSPSALLSLGSTLGSAMTAGLAPIAGRSGTLDRLVRMLAPFRYSRYDDSDPLEHEARADVYEVVNDAPGAYLSEVADEADLPLSTARHHIRVLEREDLVSGAKVRGKRRFYPAYTQGIELAAALNDEATAAVIDAVSRLGAASVSDLADELGRDPSTVSHHLKRLAEDDIIVRERDGRAVMNKLSAEARTALEPGHDSPTAEVGEAMASD